MVFRKVFMKYRIMIVRNKISYMAMRKCMTIKELIASTVLDSFKKFVKSGHILVSSEEMKRNDEIFFALIRGEEGIIKRLIS